ncbi:hypothetical protein IJ707_04160, partial [bacterium]|nr:hypothetical protein [bacterium]
MKKLFLFISLILFCASANADENLVLQGLATFDWATKTQFERDENISKIKNILYKNDMVVKYKKNELKEEYKNFLKDKEFEKHYIEISNGQKQNETERLSGFYTKGGKIMYMYGVQYKNDIYTTYYYDMMGNLRYIDK